MFYHEDRVDDLRIAYIGGGSRGWAWGFMTDLAREPQLSGVVRLYDIDRTAAEHNAVIGNRLKDREDAPGKWSYEVSDTLEQTLTGADFVVISILPGTFDEMESDVHAPERLGIYQSVGDTAGPGGMIRALRTLPMFAKFAEGIRTFCPKAWVINYTNPMSLCVKILYHVFPEIKAFGCCHEVFGTQDMLAGILQAKGVAAEKPARQDILINVKGINHFTWFDRASFKGVDIFPVYREYVSEHFEEGFVSQDLGNWMNRFFNCRHRVKFDLFNRYGLIAAAGDRHLAEFMPGEMYLKDPATVESWGFGLTPVSWRKEDLERRLERSDRLVRGEEQLDLKATGEEGFLLIKALCGLTRLISNVNIPNHAGQIPNLPTDAVVETNALFERDSIRPVAAGELPPDIHALVLPHILNHERILKASITFDRDLVYRAFILDPLCRDRASDTELMNLADDMIKATAAYLPKGWFR